MIDMIDDNNNKKNFDNYQTPVKQIKPFFSLNTKQILSCLFITEDGEIFVGTKYWLSIYYFSEKRLIAKNHISIGSEINDIDSYNFENSRYIALATSDGFISLLRIKYTDNILSVDTHERLSIYNGEAKLVSILDQNTIVTVGDNSLITIITKSISSDKSWNQKQYKRKNNITALKYYKDQIFIGYENGEIETFMLVKEHCNDAEMLTSKMKTTKSSYQFKSAILGFYFNPEPIVVTEQSYYELDQFLKVKDHYSFSFKANKVSVVFDNIDGKNMQRMIVSDSNQVNIYENNKFVSAPALSSKSLISLSFLGDALIALSSQSVSLYKI